MGLRLGDKAPDFEAQTSNGPIKFSDFAKDSWVLFFSHPADRTPVCTTELSALALRDEEFKKRGVKLIGLSVDDVDSHNSWIKDIDALSNGASPLEYPIIADQDRKIATLYDMLDHQDVTNVDAKGLPLTVRSVFVIDPKGTIRLTLTYPASTGRNFPEILRTIDSLQLGDKHKIATPANWVPGEDVIVRNDVKNDEAAKLFGDDVKVVYPYLRFTSDPSGKKVANGN